MLRTLLTRVFGRPRKKWIARDENGNNYYEEIKSGLEIGRIFGSFWLN